LRGNSQDEGIMSQRGFSLIELLLSCLLLMAVTGAAAAMAIPARHAFERTIGSADLIGGARAALERLVSDVREAGSGASVGSDLYAAADVLASVVPLGGIDLPPAVPGQAIRITRVPAEAPQGILRQPVAAGDTTLVLETASNCAIGGEACGLRPGTNALVFDQSRAEPVVVTAVAPGGVVLLSTGVRAPYEIGAAVASVVITTYGLRPEADGSQRLVRMMAGGPEQPLLQHVVGFEVHMMATSSPTAASTDDSTPTYGPTPPPPGIDDPRDAWGPGENCMFSRDGNGRLIARLAPSASSSLVALSSSSLADGPWCADALDPLRYDADLLRIRLVELRVRVEAASAVWRGPVARLFRRPGNERNAARWVPDVELRALVRLRNAH
jgi:hypothetical protein